MIFKLVRSDKVLITRVDAGTLVLALTGKYAEIWLKLDAEKSNKNPSPLYALQPETKNFLNFLNRENLLPDGLTLESATQLAKALINTDKFTGSYASENANEPMEVVASWLDGPYGEACWQYEVEYPPMACAAK